VSRRAEIARRIDYISPPTNHDTAIPWSPPPPWIEKPIPREQPEGDAPYLNTRFDGIGPDQLLPVGRRIPLIIWIGRLIENNRGQSSRPFTFSFSDGATPIPFTVRVHADPDLWTIKSVEPTLIAVPPDETLQEAEFVLIAHQTGKDKLYITVEQTESRVIVQHVWLPVDVGTANDHELSVGAVKLTPFETAILAQMTDYPLLPNDSNMPSLETGTSPRRIEAILPLAILPMTRRNVHITIHSGRDNDSFMAVVDADLAGERVVEAYTVPVSGADVQNATMRLREELTKIVFYEAHEGGQTSYPFANFTTLKVDEQLARVATVPLADAGKLIWTLLFNAARTPDGLKRIANDLRLLPQGSSLQIVIDSQQFILPWGLLYNKPGPVTLDTLDWEGFWGYRYLIDVLPPGRYPSPIIHNNPLDIQLFLNDDENLRPFTLEQELFVKRKLAGIALSTAWGTTKVSQVLANNCDAGLMYFFCHGIHKSGAIHVGMLASESALYFSSEERMRLADLKDLVQTPFIGRPLIFLNACEGAAQAPFHYDGFMPFFIEERGARGFIGAEVKAPQLLAHDFALAFLRAFATGQPVGEILLQLRRYYLDVHHTILAFNYSLYGLNEIRLDPPLPPIPA
jgi:hypothetical protein